MSDVERLRETIKKLLEETAENPEQFKKKLDKALKNAGLKNIEATRTYHTELLEEWDSSRERGENPQLLVLRTFNKKRNRDEVQVVFIGEKHREKLQYYKVHPSKWNRKRWGYHVLTPEQAKEVGEALIEASKEVGFFPTTVKVNYWILKEK